MKVLSLFDGISGARVALENNRRHIEKYYASEIDPAALQVAQTRFPDTEQVGDIRQLHASKTGAIDLLIGGSPCQDLAKTGPKTGLSGKRSELFYDFLRLRDAVKPRYFLLENVVGMKPDARDEISRLMGVEPIKLNSNMVVPQNRSRYYWTNIPAGMLSNFWLNHFKAIKVPLDAILESFPPRNYYRPEMVLVNGNLENPINSYCLDASYHKGGNLYHYLTNSRRQLVVDFHTPCSNALYAEYIRSGSVIPIIDSEHAHRLGSVTFHPSTTVEEARKSHGELYKVRRLTPLDCERLQGFPDHYTNVNHFRKFKNGSVKTLSDMHRYQVLGNSFTIPIIQYLLYGIS